MKLFDVFLAHNHKDKPLIRKIYSKLKEEELNPWLDEEEIAPGTRFQDEIQQVIGEIKSAAICIGKDGLGSWQGIELNAFINLCTRRNIKVIPVLLPGVDNIPEEYIFLENFHSVQFSKGIEDEKALYQLVWGICGEKPIKLKSMSRDKSNGSGGLSFEAEDITLDARCIDLNHYLKLQRWLDADRETRRLIHAEVGVEEHSRLKSRKLLTFSRHLLTEIDRLWLKHSNGQFGFSAQQEVYVDCGGVLDGEPSDPDVYMRFMEAIGHEVCDVKGFGFESRKVRFEIESPIRYDIKSPKGHLPSIPSVGDIYKSLAFTMFRISECNLFKS